MLLSIRPRHAENIFNGTKTVELRRVRPRISEGDFVLVYVTSPTKMLVGSFHVKKILEREPQILWPRVRRKSGLTRREYDEYFRDASVAIGIFLRDVWKLERPLRLDVLRKHFPRFVPPQSYRYLSEDELGVVNTLQRQ